MGKYFQLMSFGILFSLVLVFNAAASDRPNIKIRHCLKAKECRFIVTDPAKEDPKMTFLVLDNIWKSFHDGDKDNLREVLKKKIKDANNKPEKYVRMSKKSSSYDMLVKNIKNMRSYAVVISYKKSPQGELQQDEEVLVNY